MEYRDGALFRDRESAAIRLSEALAGFRGIPGVVLAVPRGGVPLGKVIAKSLDWPLQPLMIKKLGHPQNPEYAIGAVSTEGVFIEGLHPEVSAEFIQQESERLSLLLRKRQDLFMKGRAPVSLAGKPVLIVDDGAATGRTLVAGVKSVRRQGPSRIVVAVPVASAEALVRLREVADEVVCLAAPDEFFGVGQFYTEFPQVEDEEVQRLLDKD